MDDQYLSDLKKRSMDRGRGRGSSVEEIVQIASPITSSDEESFNFDDLVKRGNLQSFSKKINHNEHYTNFFGFKFLTKNLQERNKDPIILLWAILLVFFIFFCLTFITYIYATNFHYIFCIFQPILVLNFLFVVYKILNLSISEFNDPPNNLKISIGIIKILGPSMDLYGFLLVTPFQKQSLFILCLFFVLLSFTFFVGMSVTKNETSLDQKNYQLEFFFNRFMVAFINTVGLIDVISDIVLGIDDILKFRLIYILIGIFLILFGLVDIFYLTSRVSNPDLFTMKNQIFVTILEVFILGLSVANLIIDRSLERENSDSENDILEVGLISITSTSVNLIHHVALIVIQKMNINEVSVIKIQQQINK